MAYLDDEISVHDGEPIELYQFTGPNTAYRMVANYETLNFDVGAGSVTWTSTEIRRTANRSGSAITGEELQIDMPVSEQLIQDYAFGVPSNTLLFDLYRAHVSSGNYQRVWTSRVAAISIQGRLGKILAPSKLSSAVRPTLPRVRYQALCNHRFGDARCGVSLATHTHSTTVASIASDDVTITLTDTAPYSPGWGVGGHLVRVADGERRMIIAAPSVGVVEVIRPFRSLSALDDIQLVRGCARDITTCHIEFANAQNFGGFPYIPKGSIFKYGLKSSG